MRRLLQDGQRPLPLQGGDWNSARRIDGVYGPRGKREFFERMVDAGEVLLACDHAPIVLEVEF